MDLQSKLFVAADDKAQPGKRNTELAERFFASYTWRSRLADARACVVTPMNGFYTGAETTLIQRWEMIGKLKLNFATLIRIVFCAACVELVKISVSDLTTASVAISSASSTEPLSTDAVGLARGGALIDLDVVLFKFVLFLAEAGDASAIEKSEAGLIGKVRSSHPSASHAVSTSCPTGSNDNKPLVIDKDFTTGCTG